MKLRWILRVGLCALLVAPLATQAAQADSSPPINFEGLQFTADSIEAAVPLPITGMTAINRDGQIHYVSKNGRFVLTGQMYDLWYGEFVDSIEQMKDLGSRIDLKKMGLDPASLNSVSFGTGSKQVVMFTDPLCSYCHALANDLKAFENEYTVHLVVIPALGEKSNELASKVSCALDKDEALAAVLNGTLDTLPLQENCDQTTYQSTLVASQVLDINGVPFLIADDGRVARGRPSDLGQWLKGGDS